VTRSALALGALAAVVVGGCAAPAMTPRAPVTVPDAAYRAARSGREALSRGMEADVRAWTRVDGRALPGVRGRVLVAGPDAVRLRLHGPFGAVLDGVLRDDALTVVVPSRRWVVEVAAVSESIGVRSPGALLVHALAATWADTASARSPGTAAAALAIGARALPARAEWRAPDGRRFAIDYLGWTWVRGVAWPAHWKMTSEAGTLEIECRLDRVRPVALVDEGRLRVAVPSDAGRVGPSALVEALEGGTR